MNSFWTKEKSVRLVVMWREHTPYPVIAKKLGTTANAVISKLSRLRKKYSDRVLRHWKLPPKRYSDVGGRHA